MLGVSRDIYDIRCAALPPGTNFRDQTYGQYGGTAKLQQISGLN